MFCSGEANYKVKLKKEANENRIYEKELIDLQFIASGINRFYVPCLDLSLYRPEQEALSFENSKVLKYFVVGFQIYLTNG